MGKLRPAVGDLTKQNQESTRDLPLGQLKCAWNFARQITYAGKELSNEMSFVTPRQQTLKRTTTHMTHTRQKTYRIKISNQVKIVTPC